MTRIAIIGAGGHSQAHHGPAAKALKFRLGRSAIVDLDRAKAQEYAAQFDINDVYDNIEKMMSDFKPDALIAITPTTVTAKVIRQLIPYGLPILAEKPFGDTLELTRTLCDEVRKADAHILLSFNRRFAPACARAMQLLRDRFAGRPLQHVRGTMLRNNRREPEFLTGTGVHLIDTMHMFAGSSPQQINAMAMANPQHNHAAVHAQMLYDKAVTGDLTIHSACGQLAETYELFGPNYGIVVDVFRGIKAYDSGELVIDEPYAPDISGPEKDGAIAEFASFLDHVESGDLNFSPNPQDALNAAIVGDTLLRIEPHHL